MSLNISIEHPMMRTFALFLLTVCFVCGQQEDSKCVGVLAESYTPFRKDEHNRTGYVINEVRRVHVDHNGDDIIVTKKRHEKEFLATGLPHDDSIRLPRKLAERLFGPAVGKNEITVGCKQQFNLEFRIGTHWLIIILIITLIIFIICYRNVKRIYAKTLQELSIRLTALEGGLAKVITEVLKLTDRTFQKGGLIKVNPVVVKKTVDEKARKKTSEDKQAINPPAVEQPVKQPAAQQPAQPTPQQSTPAVAKLEKSVTARDD
ncbi:hypothetical protein M3Y94_00658300 [Aphelenchoides besseyi]|nr:hypothetical protein M3Y94_00658300 [Aphelenchoides besseyi]